MQHLGKPFLSGGFRALWERLEGSGGTAPHLPTQTPADPSDHLPTAPGSWAVDDSERGAARGGSSTPKSGSACRERDGGPLERSDPGRTGGEAPARAWCGTERLRGAAAPDRVGGARRPPLSRGRPAGRRAPSPGGRPGPREPAPNEGDRAGPRANPRNLTRSIPPPAKRGERPECACKPEKKFRHFPRPARAPSQGLAGAPRSLRRPSARGARRRPPGPGPRGPGGAPPAGGRRPAGAG